MKTIKLTFTNTGNKVYVNSDYLVYFYQYSKKDSYYQDATTSKRTHILVLGHNNGGFDVAETPQKILELIGKE